MGKRISRYELATCCNPIPGDEIIVFQPSDSHLFQVHRTKCQTATGLLSSFGNRFVKVSWTPKNRFHFSPGSNFQALTG